MKVWNAALIGCGAVSRMHLEALAKMPNVKLVAVCDIKKDVAMETAKKYGCKAFTDYNEMLKLEEIEVVHISTPHYLHAPMALAAMAAGKKVLTEKPITHDLSDAAEMVKAAKAGGYLGVCFQNRYNTSSVRAKEIIDSGKYGKIRAIRGSVAWHREAPYYVDSGWRGKMATEGGGVLINQAIHTLDLILWFAGEPKSVKGAVSTDALQGIIDVEDSAHFIINFKSGVRGAFYATTAYGADSPIQIEVLLEGATLQLRADSLYIIENGKEEELLVPLPVNELGIKGYWGVSHGILIEDFYRTLEAGKHFWIDAEVGYTALNVLKSVYRSSAENATIEL